MKGLVIAIAMAALAFVVGRWSAGGAPVSASAVGAAAQGSAAAPAPRLDPASAGAVRTIIRQELAAAPAAPKPEEPPPVERDPVALAKAHDLVDRAVAVGHWTTADARALKGVLPRLTADEWEEVMTALAAHANEGRLRVETSGSLLAPEEVK